MPTANDLGRATGHARRLRTVTPHRLVLAVVSALAARRVEILAALLRAFNHQQGVRMACKRRWNGTRPTAATPMTSPRFRLIWAGLCAALSTRLIAHAAQRVGHGAAISTLRVAMCAHLRLTDLVPALVRGRGLPKAWHHAMEYRLANAARSNLPREKRIGRLPSGLALVGGARVTTNEDAMAVSALT